MAAAVGAALWWWPDDSPAPPPRVEDELPLASAPTVPPVDVQVHAAGAVQRPGLYRLSAESRVADLIEAAGGARDDADLDRINLAAPVADGGQVFVPVLGEPYAGVEAGGAGSGSDAGPIDLNVADVSRLESLPGVGPATAQAIVSHREEHGRFAAVEELLDVRGIGPAKLDALRDLVVAGP